MPIPLPTWAAGPALGLLGKLWPVGARYLGFGHDPQLVIGLANPVDKAREPYLEWLRLTVLNVGLPRASATRTAREGCATVTIQGQPGRHRLMWSNAGEFGRPLEKVDIARNIGQDLPLVLRVAATAGPQPLILRTPVQPGICYITDVNFLTQGSAEIALTPGIHVLEVALQYGNAQLVPIRCLRLTIPPPDVPLRLTLAEMDC